MQGSLPARSGVSPDSTLSHESVADQAALKICHLGLTPPLPPLRPTYQCSVSAAGTKAPFLSFRKWYSAPPCVWRLTYCRLLKSVPSYSFKNTQTRCRKPSSSVRGAERWSPREPSLESGAGCRPVPGDEAVPVGSDRAAPALGCFHGAR